MSNEEKIVQAMIESAFLNAELDMSNRMRDAIDDIGDRLAKLKREMEELYADSKRG